MSLIFSNCNMSGSSDEDDGVPILILKCGKLNRIPKTMIPKEDPLVDIDSLPDKPWRNPNVDPSDYFNYGFTEKTWKEYVQKQSALRTQNLKRNHSLLSSRDDRTNDIHRDKRRKFTHRRND